MSYCRKCGKEITDNAEVCPECGYPNEVCAESAESKKAAQKTANELVESNFGKAIASAACSWAPIACIVAIVLGCRSLKAWQQARILAEANGFRLPGKAIPLRITALVGKIVGIVMTVFWGIYFAFIFALIVGVLGCGLAYTGYCLF